MNHAYLNTQETGRSYSKPAHVKLFMIPGNKNSVTGKDSNLRPPDTRKIFIAK